jgi:hypothetical protein
MRIPVTSADERFPSLLVAIACGALLILHLVLRIAYGTIKDGLDIVALALAAGGLSPWIASVVQSFKFGGFEMSFHDIWSRMGQQTSEIEQNRVEIDQLKFLITHFLPDWGFYHLQRLQDDGPYEIDLDTAPAAFATELRHLRALGFIEHADDKTIHQLVSSGYGLKDMKQFFRITDSGQEILRYRLQVEQSESLPEPQSRGGSACALPGS